MSRRRRSTYHAHALLWRLRVSWERLERRARLRLARILATSSELLAKAALRYYAAADRMPPTSTAYQVHLLLWSTLVAVMLAALAVAIITNP